jgi:AmmeMemoRadiSam system protein B/AmmeMemoRadiSam system protein A
MRKTYLYLGIISFLLLHLVCAAEEQPAPVRPPAVAGQFYPREPAKLKLAVSGFLNDAVKADTPRPIAIIVPHAGYIYSGQIIADGFRQASGYNWDVVVILGTNHTTPGFNKVAIYPKGAFRTPLGLVRIEEETSARLRATDPDFIFNAALHAREHSIEVQLPFVQNLFPNVPIIAAIISEPDIGICRRFGEALAKTLRGRQALIVASSDLSHYPVYDDAVSVDRTILEAIVTLRPEDVYDAIRSQMNLSIPNLLTCACGEAPIMSAMFAARAMDATRGAVISYANSGDALVGDATRVVGYGAVVLTAGNSPSDTRALNRSVPGGKLTPEDKKKLLTLARETILRYLTSETIPLARGFSPAAQVRQGAFVTLKEHGELRGCIGHMLPDSPLCRTVGAMALEAAFQDRRFPPMTLDEVSELEIEISALTPWRTVPDASGIVLGRDGVVIRKAGRSAVYLPQVATEQGWTREEMLDSLCLKAGLARGSWKQGAELLTFQAEVFSEADFKTKRKLS